MNRVVLVDDEQFVRKGIIALIDWDKINYEVVGEASNGEDALEVILKEEPDVVLTDIRMPVYDGLELIDRVKQKADKVPKFVVVSGYSDFEYAQRAVRLGVTDFILKPVDKKELEAVFVELSPLIEKERHEEQASQRIMNFSMYQRLIVEGEKPTEAEANTLIGGFKKRSCYVMIEFRDGLISDRMDEELSRAITNFIGDQFIFMHPFERDGFGVVFQENHLPKQINEMPWFLSRLKSYLEQELSRTLFLFAGDIKKGVEGLIASYETALLTSERRFCQLGDEPLMYSEKVASAVDRNESLDHEHIRRLLEKIEENNHEAISEQVKKFSEDVRRIAAPIDVIKIFMFQLEKELETTIHHLVGHNALMTELDSIVNQFSPKKTLEELQAIILNYAIQASTLLARLNKEVYQGDIYKVKRFINQHYDENLTLKKIANQFYMNPVYLGQLFKKTYGIYFKDYLLKVRIDKAKQILRQTDLRIYEVAEAVGFGSPDYFVTQFEKIEGNTPSRYRQQILQ
ncbi:two-component system, response regulator YesN [Pelagirhabdus alkalitolerans]|uniref:Two-component system, response regulator YesN n=1 Tax=Pelagirhabdus alkalitolerans TaxID=1612202 RepID=A0A1G6JTW0_9BACI|nr:response regulator transcription factor [Pelagirhabdus alkalitolerans]SDC22182.1 two-component system, response regulator YesN [Pelagirhabdus alkalitolerans]